MRTVFWFRQDLRLIDNTSLYHAAHNADDGLLLLYVICWQDWQEHAIGGVQIDFILRQLEALGASLAEYDLCLECLIVDKRAEIPGAILELMQGHDIDTLVANKQYEVNENARDHAVKALLEQHDLAFARYDDQCVIAPGMIKKDDGEPYKVFTPFKKRWVQLFNQSNYLSQLTLPKKIKAIAIQPQALPNKLAHCERRDLSALWPVGEAHAKARLAEFIDERGSRYKSCRDLPALNGTSQLSPYLACGILSPRHCFEAAFQANRQRVLEGDVGLCTWMSELIWREFYKHILFHYPHVCRNQAFKAETDKLQWDEDEEAFEAWCQGQTGYPLVDAAMRQLNQSGWMHNRLRMLVAMFLTKDLLIDWRRGEAYFSKQLIDLDFASNNGGWQWAAGTGTDAAPYFRIFNPITQSEKFDKQGDFIRQYCPELASLSDKEIHFPSDDIRQQVNYPLAIVDHKLAREAFLERYRRDVK